MPNKKRSQEDRDSFHLARQPLSYAQAASLSPSGSAGANCTFPPQSLMPVTSQQYSQLLASTEPTEQSLHRNETAVWASQTLPHTRDVQPESRRTATAWSFREASSVTPRPFISLDAPLLGPSGGPVGNWAARLTGHQHEPIVAAAQQKTEVLAAAALGSGERWSLRQRRDIARPQEPESATHREFAAVNAGAAAAGDWPARQYTSAIGRGRPAPAEAAGVLGCGSKAEERYYGGRYGNMLASASTPAQPAPPAGAAVSASGEADWQPSSRAAGRVSSADGSKAGSPPDDSDSERTAGLDPGQSAAASRRPPGAESDPFHDDYPYW